MKNVVFVLVVVASELLASLCYGYKRMKDKKDWKELKDEFDEKMSSRRLYEKEEWELESVIEELREISKRNGWS